MTDAPETPEWSVPIRLADLAVGDPVDRRISASPDTLTALTRRFGILAIEEAEAVLTAERQKKDRVRVHGQLRARVVQACVVTLEPVATDLEVPVEILLLAPGDQEPHAVEMEAPEDEGDVDRHDGLTVDLGEIAAQTLALHLPDYPRAEGAALPEGSSEEAGGVGEGRDNPFAALAALKSRDS